MASTMASNERTAWLYSSGAIDYCVSAKKAYVEGADAAKFGGGAAEGTERSLPNGIRPRKAQVYNATANVSRWLIVYSTDAALWTTPGTTVTLNYKGVDTVFTSTGQTLGEKPERKTLKGSGG